MIDPWREIESNILGKSLRITRRESDWVFDFGENLGFGLCVQTPWRLRNELEILLTDSDDGQRFGLVTPIDAEARGNELMTGAVVTAFCFDVPTADLKIEFSNGVRVEILTNSSGYESWQAYLGTELVAVAGNGGLR